MSAHLLVYVQVFFYFCFSLKRLLFWATPKKKSLPDLNLAKLTLIVMVLATLLYHYLKVLLEPRSHVLCSVSVFSSTKYFPQEE